MLHRIMRYVPTLGSHGHSPPRSPGNRLVGRRTRMLMVFILARAWKVIVTIFCFVHRTESFPTLSVQTLGLHTDGAVAMGSVTNEIDWISHQTLSSPCRITDRSKSEHLHLDQLPSQVFLALISEESSVGWEEWRHWWRSESDAPRFEDDSDVEG